MSIQVVETPSFKKARKKLHANQKKELDDAVKVIMADLSIGDAKVGDLAGVFVYKFKMVKQLTLLAYRYDEEEKTLILTLLALGSHENFYRDLKG